MHSTTRSFVLVPAVLLAGGTLYLLGRFTAPGAEFAGPQPVPEIAAPASNSTAELPRETREIAVADETALELRGTVREVLEAHYGKPWSEIEPLLEKEHLDPNANARLLPWETVAAEFRRQVVRDTPENRTSNVNYALQWPDGNAKPNWYSGTLNPDKKPLSQVDLQNLERVVTEYDSRLSDLASELNEVLPRCMADQWDRGVYTKAPLVDTVDARVRQGGALGEFRKAIVSHGAGWHVQFDFESANYPDLESLSVEIRSMKQERTERVRDYIAAL